MEERIKKLEAQLSDLMAWKAQRERQQIAYPLDTTSESIIGSTRYEGTGTAALIQTISLSGAAEDIDVPAAYSDTIVVSIGSTRVEIPIIAFL